MNLQKKWSSLTSHWGLLFQLQTLWASHCRPNTSEVYCPSALWSSTQEIQVRFLVGVKQTNSITVQKYCLSCSALSTEEYPYWSAQYPASDSDSLHIYKTGIRSKWDSHRVLPLLRSPHLLTATSLGSLWMVVTCAPACQLTFQKLAWFLPEPAYNFKLYIFCGWLPHHMCKWHKIFLFLCFKCIAYFFPCFSFTEKQWKVIPCSPATQQHWF